MRVALVFLAATASFLAGCGGGGREPAVEAAETQPETFPASPENLDVWLERLEVGSREIYSARDSIVDALSLAPGARVADIGAGTGVYSLLFAEEVGPEGVVYAIDIEARFLTLINQRAEDLGFDNVVSVLGRAQSITLPPQSVDIAFICDTYHYFDDPAALMKTVHEALRPGGRLYIIDFNVADGAALPAEKRHVRMGRDGVAAEIAAFGFGPAEVVTAPGLAENYMLRFVKP